MNDNPVFIVGNDADDANFFQQAWNELNLPNKLYFFNYAEEVIEKLEGGLENPFLIISEINLPKISGIELKKYLVEHKELNFKSIPFVFFTDGISQKQVEKAYSFCTNGIFQKADTLNKMKEQLLHIINYWGESLVPNDKV